MQAPKEVSGNPKLSEIWERVTDGGRSVTPANADLYVQLCWWYLDLKSCREFATSRSGSAQAFMIENPQEKDEFGNPKQPRFTTLPFTAEMERAQKAIEGIERQLGTKTSSGPDSKKASVLSLVISDRQKKAAQANG